MQSDYVHVGCCLAVVWLELQAEAYLVELAFFLEV